MKKLLTLSCKALLCVCILYASLALASTSSRPAARSCVDCDYWADDGNASGYCQFYFGPDYYFGHAYYCDPDQGVGVMCYDYWEDLQTFQIDCP